MFGLNKEDERLKDQDNYRWLIWHLLYLAMTRPAISFVVQRHGQFMHCSKNSHYASTLRVVRYINNKLRQCILLGVKCNMQLSVYCDSEWASCPVTRKPVSGFSIKLGYSLISWKVKGRNTVSRSSAKVEYRATGSAVAEVIWIRGLLMGFAMKQEHPAMLLCDNKVSLQIVVNLMYHERTKHIEADCHFIRHHVVKGEIRTCHIGTKN